MTTVAIHVSEAPSLLQVGSFFSSCCLWTVVRVWYVAVFMWSCATHWVGDALLELARHVHHIASFFLLCTLCSGMSAYPQWPFCCSTSPTCSYHRCSIDSFILSTFSFVLSAVSSLRSSPVFRSFCSLLFSLSCLFHAFVVLNQLTYVAMCSITDHVLTGWDQ